MFKVFKVFSEFGLFVVGLSFFVNYKSSELEKPQTKQEQQEPDFVKGIVCIPPVVDMSNAWLRYSSNTGDIPQWRIRK